MANRSKENNELYETEDDGNESLLREYKRLEQEKQDLEKKTTERRSLEKKLRDLRSSVSQLRESSRRNDSSENRASGSGSMTVPVSVQDFLNRSSSSQSHTPSRCQGQPAEAEDSEADSDSEEQMMSARHKELLQGHRDVLVENMLPDDVLNDLIAARIITSSHAARIKDRGSREAVNEELLDNLTRRCDRGFAVLVRSLRKSLQGYLAKLLDPDKVLSGTPSRGRRKRRAGEMNVNVECLRVDGMGGRGGTGDGRGGGDGEPRSCSCQEVEEQILTMARLAYANIRRRDATPASFEQFRKELTSTNQVIRESVEIVNTLKMLCRHGDITAISSGSVLFSIRPCCQAGAWALWSDFQSGELQQLLQSGLVSASLLSACRASSIQLRITVDGRDFARCCRELEQRRKTRRQTRSESRHLCSHQKECEPKKRSWSSTVHSPSPRDSPKRKPFREIHNENSPSHQSSPNPQVPNCLPAIFPK